MTRAAALAVALGLSLAAPARAHELGLVQVDAAFQKDGTFVLDLLVDVEHLPARPGGARAPEAFLRSLEEKTVLAFDGAPARLGAAGVDGPAGGGRMTRLRFSGRTPSGVARVTFANAAISGFFVVRFRNEGPAAPVTLWVEGGKTSAPFTLDGAVVPPSRWKTVGTYVALGFTHILPAGLDHVLFVLGIFLLAAELKPVLWQVTAFTLAHTTTLALSVYGVVSLPASVVEPLIALSIVAIAVENVATTKLHAWRPAVVFAFGLLHGLGFAGVLADVGLPRAELLPALLAFNVGVEAGQLTVILAAFLAVGLPFRARPWFRRGVAVPASLAIAAVGLYWSVERVFFAT